jgi:hypothetical protein
MAWRFGNRRQPVDPADDLIAEGRGLSGGFRILLTHVFPMMQAMPSAWASG